MLMDSIVLWSLRSFLSSLTALTFFQEIVSPLARTKHGRPTTMLKKLVLRNLRLRVKSRKDLGSPNFFDQSVGWNKARRMTPP